MHKIISPIKVCFVKFLSTPNDKTLVDLFFPLYLLFRVLLSSFETHEMLSSLLSKFSFLIFSSSISFFYFHPEDVVRHGLVQKIIEAYEKNSW